MQTARGNSIVCIGKLITLRSLCKFGFPHPVDCVDLNANLNVMKLFKGNPKDEKDIPDEISQMLLIRHIYLLEMSGLILAEAQNQTDKLYYQIPIEEQTISNILESSKYNIPAQDIDPCVSYLVISDYIKMGYKDDTKTVKLVSATKPGWKAMTSGEFKQQHDQRQRDLVQLNLAKSTIKSNKNQKWMNMGLIFATALAAIMPFVVAWKYSPTVNVPVQPFHQDIRIDSVWLHQQVDVVIQKKLSTLRQEEAREQQPPKKGVQ